MFTTIIVIAILVMSLISSTAFLCLSDELEATKQNEEYHMQANDELNKRLQHKTATIMRIEEILDEYEALHTAKAEVDSDIRAAIKKYDCEA